jgi:hypothetical protein
MTAVGFLPDEVMAALHLVMEPDEAAQLLRDCFQHESGSIERISPDGFTGDTLALLSLLSDDLRARVDQHLIEWTGSIDDSWTARRSELERDLRLAGRLPRP